MALYEQAYKTRTMKFWWNSRVCQQMFEVVIWVVWWGLYDSFKMLDIIKHEYPGESILVANLASNIDYKYRSLYLLVSHGQI